MSKRLGLILAILLTIASVASCAPPLTEEEPPTPTPLPTPVVPEKAVYEVKRGTIEDSVDFLCRVAPVREQELYFKMDGRIATVNVEKGDTVKAGDVLATLEVSDIMNQAQQAQVDLEKAQLVLEQAKADLAEQLAEAQRDLQIAEANLARAKEDQAFAVQQAQINLDTARIRLAQAQLADPAVDLREAERELEIARAALQSAQIAYAEAKDDPEEAAAANVAYQRALLD